MVFARQVFVLLLAVLPLTLGAAESDKADFTIQDIQGKTQKLSDYRGKWVIVNYWASWCPPCLEEIPDLVDFHDRHKDKDAVVLGINTEGLAVKALQDFSDSYLISYPVVSGEPDAGASYMLGPIPALPTTYIVSPQGEVLARQVGPLTSEMIEGFMAEQCKEKPKLYCQAGS